MGITVLFFFVVIALLSALGLVADSHDSADWKPTLDGMRSSR